MHWLENATYVNWCCGQCVRQKIRSCLVPAIECLLSNDCQFCGDCFRGEMAILTLETIVRNDSLTFQHSRHDSRVPQICYADQQKTNILNRFIRIRTGIAVQQSN